jgi:hypothetical protein
VWSKFFYYYIQLTLCVESVENQQQVGSEFPDVMALVPSSDADALLELAAGMESEAASVLVRVWLCLLRTGADLMVCRSLFLSWPM